MILEALTAGLLVTIVLVPIVRQAWSIEATSSIVAAAFLCFSVSSLAAAFVLQAWPAPPEEHEIDNRPIRVGEDDYVSSTACRACHPAQYGSWHASYHRTMTQVASRETVLGATDAGEQRHRGIAGRLFEKDDQVRGEVTMYRPTGEVLRRLDRPVVMTTGSHHTQAYWIEGQDRQVALYPYLYNFELERFVPMYAQFLLPPGTDPGIMGNQWNSQCIMCHATNGKPRLRASGEMMTTAAEFGIACEACHGPGEEHIKANRSPARRYGLAFGDHADDTIVLPTRLSVRRGSEVCGQCHSAPANAVDTAYMHNGWQFRPGDDLEARRPTLRISTDDAARLARDPQLRTYVSQRMWSDGMIRITGREYNGLLETACFQRGELSCLSCHSMHRQDGDDRPFEEWADDQLKPEALGDETCVSCHEAIGERVEAHTHHPPGSAGSTCYNCHMPHSSYGLLKAVRSHQVSNPTVQESIEVGRPNACNLCHLDRSFEWTADYLDEWYDVPSPSLDADQREVAASVLWALRGDAGQRALAAWHMGWQPAQEASGTEWIAPYLAQLLEDPYYAVRILAYRSLRSLDPFDEFEYDFVGRDADLAGSHDRARALWADSAPDARLLQSRGVPLDRARYDALLMRRDETPIQLVE